jgi:hypothetical protein
VFLTVSVLRASASAVPSCPSAPSWEGGSLLVTSRCD